MYLYSLVTFLVGMSGAILVNHARFMRDIRRDTVEIREIHAGLTRWWRIKGGVYKIWHEVG